jgi:adenylate cyclase
MSPESFKRKLTAILSADVKGYSRLMGEDEVATVRTLKEYRELMSKLIKESRGRVVDSPGDNVLAEFASVVDALQCSIEIQKELKSKNAVLPDNRKMNFRIGVNLGDVIEDEDRVYGDGVNIAARIEGLAEPGGICISGSGFEQVRNKLQLGYQYLGEHTVKNIVHPVKVYRVLMEPEHAGKVIGEKGPRGLHWRWAAAAAIVLVAGALALWNFYFRPPPIEPASKEKMAFPLPDKPSIAVLPFVNMSDDPQQEYFSDGMTEDLITDLSKISGLFVIARNSTFTYKGKPVKIRQVAEELGVRYVLEGSVRRAGDQVRINAQLIDSTTGQHLWAERYDGSMRDVFSLQDKINQKIVAALAVKLTAGEKTLLSEKGTNDPAAYEEFMKGREYYLKFTSGDLAKAEACFKRAIELDPNFSRAQAGLALLYFEGTNNRMQEGFKLNYEVARLRARLHLTEAMKKPTSIAYQVKGLMDLNLREWDKAISQLQKALALDPNDAASHSAMSWVLSMSGRPTEGMEYAKSGMRLDPLNPARYLGDLGIAHFCMGEWQEAVLAIEKGLKLNPELVPTLAVLASAYAHLGRYEEAKAASQAYWKRVPGSYLYYWPFKDRGVDDSFVEGLIKAGFSSSSLISIHVSNKEDQIIGDDLKAFYFPSKTTGRTPQGADWSQETTRDGTATLRSSWITSGVDTGRLWLEDDKLWTQYKKFWYGMAYCSTIFKNPRGTPELKNEYFAFSDLYLFKFSLVR